MPDVNQYTVNPKELVELIARASGVKEGKWFLTVSFGMSPGNFGPNADSVVPGILVAVQTVGIQREDVSTASPAIEAASTRSPNATSRLPAYFPASGAKIWWTLRPLISAIQYSAIPSRA